MPTSEAIVTNASVAIAVGLWYAAQSYVSPLLQVAILATIGLLLPAIYRRMVESVAEWPAQPSPEPVPGHAADQTNESATEQTLAD